MTIAACHVSPEGVVLGADSTTTVIPPGCDACHFDNAQKLFEVGQRGSTLGVVTWGQGKIGTRSHRNIVAELGQAYDRGDFGSVKEAADRLGEILWQEMNRHYGSHLERARDLTTKLAKDQISDDEGRDLVTLMEDLSGGYCIGGRMRHELDCTAFTIEWEANHDGPIIAGLEPELPIFWGQPIFMQRLIYGIDEDTLAAIAGSDHWGGSVDQLLEIVSSGQIIHPQALPLREAVDWIHTVIRTTIRALKFAKLPHSCGGPIEIAAITNDRPFRWVVHKDLDSAVVS